MKPKILNEERSALFLGGVRFLRRRDYASALRCFETDLKTVGEHGPDGYRIDLLIHIGNICAAVEQPKRAEACDREAQRAR